MLAKFKRIMRAKLLALREGRMAEDAEFEAILTETETPRLGGGEESRPPEDEHDAEEEVLEGERDDGDEEGGENNGDAELDAQVDEMMLNLMQQSAEHQSTHTIMCRANVVALDLQRGPGNGSLQVNMDFGDTLYGDDDD